MWRAGACLAGGVTARAWPIHHPGSEIEIDWFVEQIKGVPERYLGMTRCKIINRSICL